MAKKERYIIGQRVPKSEEIDPEVLDKMMAEVESILGVKRTYKPRK